MPSLIETLRNFYFVKKMIKIDFNQTGILMFYLDNPHMVPYMPLFRSVSRQSQTNLDSS